MLLFPFACAPKFVASPHAAESDPKMTLLGAGSPDANVERLSVSRRGEASGQESVSKTTLA